MTDSFVCDLCKKTLGDKGEPCVHWCDKNLKTDKTEIIHEKQTDN